MKKDSFLKSPMARALDLARDAAKEGEVPVAAIITDADGAVVAEAVNRVERDGDPTAHAEMLAIKSATGIVNNARLEDCDLWVTLEPCPMCAGAISHARIRRLYYGADDEKSGGVSNGPRIFSQSTCHHKPEVMSGLNGEEAARMLSDFFKKRR
jgi:tRNA(Arg) A34 adenosine deaminase TadA